MCRFSEPKANHGTVVQAVLTAAHALGNLIRLTVLGLLFAPVVLTAHLALQWNIGRPMWLRLLR